jgi:predicted Zn finger-like uncharacterized protein
MFKVVPDQLRVSDGWVRCGQCNEVFDANLHLQADSLPRSEPAEFSNSWSAPEAVAEAGTDSVDLPAAPDVQDQEPFLVVNPHALHFEPDAVSREAAEPKKSLEKGDELNAQPQEVEELVVVESAVEHSFMRRAPSPSIWMKRSVRVLLSISGLLLGLLLALQVVIRERDRIAAFLPETKESLKAVCQVTGCSVEPLRQIEAVVIDSSSFAKVRADVYRLSFALKNTAHTIIATPAIELTLTDMQDQPVVRRVFTAEEFGGKSGAMDPGAELSVTMPISVKMDSQHEKISGYKLLSFYP